MRRRPGLVALLGSAIGLAVMLGGFAGYLFATRTATGTATSQANVERIELYAAVFIGALVFATSAIAFCKMRGTLDLSAAAHPGHGIVNVSALLLCGWLGYGFVTEQAPPFGLAALLAMSVLAAALGTHLMISHEYWKDRDSNTHAFAGHCRGLAFERRGLLARIEWHGGEEQAWALREITPGMVRAAAYRHRRGWHNTGNMGAQKRGSVRQRSSHRAMCRQK
jgi:NAD(P) transhydrogenase subunit beta